MSDYIVNWNGKLWDFDDCKERIFKVLEDYKNGLIDYEYCNNAIEDALNVSHKIIKELEGLLDDAEYEKSNLEWDIDNLEFELSEKNEKIDELEYEINTLNEEIEMLEERNDDLAE